MRFKEFLIEDSKWAPAGLPETAFYSKSNKQYVRDKILKELKIKHNVTYKKSTKNVPNDYNDWVKEHSHIAKKIFRCQPGNLGPGEALVYFIFDNVEIGGSGSPIDMYVNGKPFAEIKAANLSNGYLTDFKFGIAADKPNTDFIKNINRFIEMFKSLTGNYPDGYDPSKPSEVTINSLKAWDKYDLVDLSSLSKNTEIELGLKQNGDIKTKIDNKKVTNVNHKDAINKLKNINKNFKPSEEVVKISTITKIKDMWKREILKSPIAKHPFLFLNINSGDAISMIDLNKNNLDVHRITRGYVTIKLKI